MWWDMSKSRSRVGTIVLLAMLVMLASNNFMQFLDNITAYNKWFVGVVVVVSVLAIRDTELLKRLGGLS
jgi:hypothetical protein